MLMAETAPTEGLINGQQDTKRVLEGAHLGTGHSTPTGLVGSSPASQPQSRVSAPPGCPEQRAPQSSQHMATSLSGSLERRLCLSYSGPCAGAGGEGLALVLSEPVCGTWLCVKGWLVVSVLSLA